MDEESSEELKQVKITSAVRRLNFAFYISLGFGFLSLAIELTTSTLLSNFMEKSILFTFYCLFISLTKGAEKTRSSARLISYILGEIINFQMLYYAHIKEKECGMVWAQISPFVIMYYQSYLLETIYGMVLLSLKHTLQWSLASYYFSESSMITLSVFPYAILTLFVIMTCCCYMEHLQDIDICQSKDGVRAANKKLLSLIEAIPKCISVVSESMESIFFNSTLQNFLNSESIISYLESVKYYVRYSQPSPNNQVIDDIQYSLSLPVGTRITYGITDNNGVLIEWAGNIDMWEDQKVAILLGKDVTQLIKLEKENLESQYKSALLRTVSHELRTPTNSMLTMAQFILESGQLSQENEERIEIMISSCGYMLCLINDLLDYAQIMAGCLKVLKVAFDLSKLLNECQKIFELELSKTNIKFEIIYTTKVPNIVVADPYRLKQVIINLISNAKKFTHHGSINLLVSYEQPYLTVTCQDTGTGIEEDKLAKLFTAFGKLEDTVMNPQGVGLGLFISNMLVHELGGDYIKLSTVPGQGSNFTFRVLVGVPRLSSSTSDIAEENPNVTVPMSNSTRLIHKVQVLIVDDTYFNIVAYTQILTQEGMNCSYALNGNDAIEKIKNNKYNCVVMDCEMPIMNGWEATIELKQLAASGKIKKLPPIIGATAHDSQTVQHRCRDAGMDDVIIKPCPKTEVINKIRHWVEASKFL